MIHQTKLLEIVTTIFENPYGYSKVKYTQPL